MRVGIAEVFQGHRSEVKVIVYKCVNAKYHGGDITLLQWGIDACLFSRVSVGSGADPGGSSGAEEVTSKK